MKCLNHSLYVVAVLIYFNVECSYCFHAHSASAFKSIFFFMFTYDLFFRYIIDKTQADMILNCDPVSNKAVVGTVSMLTSSLKSLWISFEARYEFVPSFFVVVDFVCLFGAFCILV